MHQVHSAMLLTFIKLPFVIKIFVLPIFEWLFYTGFTVFGFYLERSVAHKNIQQDKGLKILINKLQLSFVIIRWSLGMLWNSSTKEALTSSQLVLH